MKSFTAQLTVSVIALSAVICQAGQPLKWDEIPEAVRKTVLANGGSAGPVDKESGSKDGKAIYEAQVKGRNGAVKDLVIIEDGKLLETKTDDAADRLQEQTECAPENTGRSEISVTHARLPTRTCL